MLWDDYDAVATWLGVCEQDTLIASLRICKRLKGQFELERYHPDDPKEVYLYYINGYDQLKLREMIAKL